MISYIYIIHSYSKAFDKCKFNKLFEKLIDKKLPAIVIRALIYMYEEQTGCVKLVGHRSDTFPLKNGRRQGSVASPIFFAVYLDGILEELRKLNLGCRIGGVWMGAAIFADDVILMSPARSSMKEMLRMSETYATAQPTVFCRPKS